MSDLYLEELVKRRKTGTDQALRYVLMALPSGLFCRFLPGT